MIANEVSLEDRDSVLLTTEHDHQTRLFAWAENRARLYPDLGLLFAIPNGGKRDIKTALKMREEGLKPGVPDVCLPVARQGWHGLFIEMKVKGNKPTAYQMEWLDKLQKQGYLALVCYGVQEAQDAIKDYLGITP